MPLEGSAFDKDVAEIAIEEQNRQTGQTLRQNTIALLDLVQRRLDLSTLADVRGDMPDGEHLAVTAIQGKAGADHR